MVRSRLLMLGRHPWVSALLVSEVVALVVLGALAWSAWRTMPVMPPVLPEEEITVFPRLDTVDNVPLRSADLLRLVNAVPGVRHAAVANQSPYSPNVSWAARAWRDDALDDGAIVATYFGSEEMLRTLGLRLTAGRNFEPSEFRPYAGDQTRMHARGSPAIISASLAERLFSRTPAIGQRLHIYDDAPLTVVGVVSELPSATNGFTQNPDGFSVLMPTWPTDARLGPLLVRSRADDRNGVAMAVERVLKGAYPRGLVMSPRSLATDRIASLDALRPERRHALSIGAGLCALAQLVTVLFTIGWMARHHRMELSLRRAFGARCTQLAREWVLELAALSGLGATVGWLLLCSPPVLRHVGDLSVLHPLETASLSLTCAVLLPALATWSAARAFSVSPHLVSRSPSVRL